MKRLTQKQLNFVLAYLDAGNRVEAYRRAYDCAGMSRATISRKAQEVAALPQVAQEIESQQNALVARHHDLKDAVIRTLKGIALADITDFVACDGKKVWLKDVNFVPKPMRGAVKHLRVTKNGFSIEMHDPLMALVTLGRMLGAFEHKEPTISPVVFNIVKPPT